MARKKRRSIVPVEGGRFVPLSFEEQDSEAYRALNGNAAKVYTYLKRAARTAACKGGGGRERDVTFNFTYSEAKQRGFSESTFIRAMRELWAKGFIDVISRGGLRGTGRTNSQYRLAVCWKTYGNGWTDRTRSEQDPFAKTAEPRKRGDAKW